MCYKAVDDCLAALKFVPDWFVTSKMIIILFTAKYSALKICYTLMKTLVMSYLFVIKWVFLI